MVIMHRLARRFQVMPDHLVIRIRCNERVRLMTQQICVDWLHFLLALANGPILQESEIWNIIIQLTCGLRAIHQANLACRCDSFFSLLFH
jgi:hypothetical protein